MIVSGEVILAIDAGTQSVRAAFVDGAGEILGFHQIAIQPFVSPQPGWAEQDPEYLWRALCDAVSGLTSAHPALTTRMAAATLAVQRLTMVNVDANGEPLRPAIIWADNRRADPAQVLGKPLLAAGKLVGIGGLLEFSAGYARSNWLQQHQPDLWERTHKYLFLSGFFTYRLTGEFHDSSANILGTIPFDTKNAEWSKSRSINGMLFPIELEKLPQAIAPGQLLGEVTARAAAATGIPVGTPIIAAASDKACDVLGAGCLTPDQGSISFGTTATFNVPIEKYLELERFLPPFPAALPGKFHTEVAVLRGLWLVSWFKEEFGLREQLAAAETGCSPEELLDDLIRDIPAGSMGLMTLPSWMPGPHGDPWGKGAVFGFGDVHTRAHLYRSILEGIVFALYAGSVQTVKKTGVPLTVVRASGGGSASDVLMQITADIFGIPTERPHTPQTSAVGAAITTALGLGWYPDAKSAVAAMTQQGQTFEPVAANHYVYRELFERVFRPSERRLAPLYKQIGKITGYPER